MFDSFDRHIHYLRVSVTDKCNMRCRYCMPEEGVAVKTHAELLSFDQITDIVKTSAELGFDKIRLTGGEPFNHRGILDLIKMIHDVVGIGTLVIITNGYLLREFSKPLDAVGLDSMNVSLDTLNPDVYRQLTRGGDSARVLDGIDAAQQAGFEHIIIGIVVDDAEDRGQTDLVKFCRGCGLILQRIRRYSILQSKSDGGIFDRPPRCGDFNRLRLTCDGIFKAVEKQ